MAINPLGLIAGATAFLGIWFGHVSVRRIEAQSTKLWHPMVIYLAAGLILELGAFFMSNKALSMVCGITGITLLWDVLEFKRQERRVQKGHAQPNPANPRHAVLLIEPGALATKDEDPSSQSRSTTSDSKIAQPVDGVQRP